MRSTDETLLKARSQLGAVNARIDNHVLNRSPMREAREVVAQFPDADKEIVERELASQQLPGLAAQGKALLFGLTSLARLNRKRLKLEKRIATLETSDRR
ncbi:MAG TPA: hypothetical protein VGP24_16405 [Glaciihabitans sp.]|jgi:hypothetical protein|nr:hypothetical protein [Glaciihabitans sp.]